MPRNRWTLDASTQAEYAKLTKRMRDAGADLAPPDPATAWIDLRHDPTGSAVRSWSDGTVFALYIRIVGVAPRTVIQGFVLSSPGWDFDPYILEDPAGRSSLLHTYKLLDGSRYDRSEVLNHRVIDKEGVVRHGNAIEGWLLAECMAAAPNRYSQSKWLPLYLSIVNQFEEVHQVSFALPVERIRKRVQPRMSCEPLFDELLPKSVYAAEWPIDGLFGTAAAVQPETGNKDELAGPKAALNDAHSMSRPRQSGAEST